MATEVSLPYKISIAKDFARVPGPRYEWQGLRSGETFLKDILRPAFLRAEEEGIKLIVDLDGTGGYSTAFLDGSFGELGREFSHGRVMATLVLISTDEPYLTTEIELCMQKGVKKVA